MRGTSVEQILERMSGVRRLRTGWQARCPSHEDKHPSLSISVGDDGKVLIHCHAGCTPEEILGRLGMSLRDLFPAGSRDGDDIPAIPSVPVPPGLTLAQYAQ